MFRFAHLQDCCAIVGAPEKRPPTTKQTAPHNGINFHQAFPSGEGGMAKP